MPGYSHPGQETTEGYIAELLKRLQGFGAGVIAVSSAGVEADEMEWVLGGSPGTTYTLRYLPLAIGVWVYLNGVNLREGTDYTLDYSTGIITVNTSNQVLTSGDVLWARYLYTEDGAAAAGSAGATLSSAVTASSQSTSVSSISLTVPSTVNAGDLLLFFPSIGTGTATTITGPAGWTATSGSLTGPGGTADTQANGGLWSKAATSGDAGATITATFSQTNRAQAILLVYPGATVAASGTSVSTTGSVSFSAPTPAASAGQTCVYFFALCRSGQGISQSGATTQATPGTTGYDESIAADAAATGSTAPAVTGSSVGSPAQPAGWVAVTVVLS